MDITFKFKPAIHQNSSPTVALSISKLLNQETLDYRNRVYKSIVPTLISTTSHLSRYVESVYVYYDNLYGKYFSSLKQYTGVEAPNSTDTEWLALYHNSPPYLKNWVIPRKVRNYTFESPKDIVTVFRRFDYMKGVMVVNLNMDKISDMMESVQIYPGSCTVVTDQAGNILFGSPGFGSSKSYGLKEKMLKLTRTEQISYDITTLKNIDNTYTKYIYYTSPIPQYNLEMISMLPAAEVFRPVHTLILAFTVIIFFSILLSISLSWSVTSGNFKQLHNLLELFQKAEQEETLPEKRRPESQNEYDIIFNNIIQTFVSNNLLKLHLTQAKVQQKDAKLAALQLQLNPHFIFNTLQTIDLEILKSQATENNSSLMIHNLSDILKYSLENTSRNVTIREEIDSERMAELRDNLTRHEFDQTSHIGIFNTNLRLFLTYGSKSAITIHSKPDWGTVAHFRIPFLKSQEA